MSKNKVTTLKEAKRLSLLKWEYIVENDGNDEELLKKIPELGDLMAECGLCELCNKPRSKKNNCKQPNRRVCPLVKKGVRCYQYNHPYLIWSDAGTKENAQVVLDMIKKIKIDE